MPSGLELQWMLVPFLACLVLSINHVYLGIHVIERKVIFVDLALAHGQARGDLALQPLLMWFRVGRVQPVRFADTAADVCAGRPTDVDRRP